MSTHSIQVIRIGAIEPHPNADSLGLVRVWGYTCAVRLGDFQPGDLAAYIEPDYVVPDVPAFAFLGGHRRIKARRLRGTWSQGLLVRAPDGASEGDDVMERMGITRYEPPPPLGLATGGEAERGPAGFHPVYDVESWRRYGALLIPGEDVQITEKLHGTSARYCYREGGGTYCGSRKEWKREDAGNLWWRALAATPWLAPFCEAHPDLTVYGEVFGQVQDLRYGSKPGEVWFRAFDLLQGNRWLDFADFLALLPDDGQRVPVLYRGPYDVATVEALSEGKSTIPGANHVREGCVVKPVVERTDPTAGRVALKCVSNAYLERA